MTYVFPFNTNNIETLIAKSRKQTQNLNFSAEQIDIPAPEKPVRLTIAKPLRQPARRRRYKTTLHNRIKPPGSIGNFLNGVRAPSDNEWVKFKDVKILQTISR